MANISGTSPRYVGDGLLTVNTALPNAANTVNTPAIDLGSTTPYPITEKFIARIDISQATGANSKNINTVIQTTGANAAGIDTANWTNIPEVASLVASGNAANVISKSFNIQLPPSTARYIRAQSAGEANGGNSSDGTVTLSLRF